jgi:hypothetical protein
MLSHADQDGQDPRAWSVGLTTAPPPVPAAPTYRRRPPRPGLGSDHKGTTVTYAFAWLDGHPAHEEWVGVLGLLLNVPDLSFAQLRHAVHLGITAPGRQGHHGAKLVDVARRAGTSAGTVSNVLNHPDRVTEATRTRVEKAIADLGFVRGGTIVGHTPHWRRSSFATWLFAPAVSGRYPARGGSRPVPLVGEPWPGIPVRGRNSQGRSDACWAPVAKGLTPHGLRHTHRTVMEDLGTEKVLMDDRMGHFDGSVSARYAHVTPSMRQRLTAGLTAQWEAALDARLDMHPSSPVDTLNRLLRARAELR